MTIFSTIMDALMAEAFIHLTTVDQLTGDLRVHPDLGHVLERELPVAKMGGIFIDLPRFARIRPFPFRKRLKGLPRPDPWFFLFHTHKPTALGLAFAELAQTDIEYQQESWPLAFVAGYFSHLALDRVLNALIQRLVREHLGDNQDHMELQYNCEHFQSLFFHREFFGEDILGTAKGYELCNILSQKGKRFEESLILFCIKGCLKAFGKAPSRRELKRWRGGFCRFSALRNKSFKIDKRIISGKTGQKIAHTFYRNDFFDFVDYYSRALELSVEYINNIFDYMRGGNYSSAAREEFTEMVPEMDIYNPPEEEQNYPLMLPEEAARFFNESVPKLDFIQEVKKEGRKILPFINPRKPAPKGPRL